MKEKFLSGLVVKVNRTSPAGVSDRLGHGEEALSQGWRPHHAFEGVSYRKDDAIKQLHGPRVELSGAPHLERPPPGEVPDEVEILEPLDLESGLEQFFTELRPVIAPEVSKIAVQWGINFHAGWNEKTQVSPSGFQESVKFLQLLHVVFDVFQDIHAEGGIKSTALVQ